MVMIENWRKQGNVCVKKRSRGRGTKWPTENATAHDRGGKVEACSVDQQAEIEVVPENGEGVGMDKSKRNLLADSAFL